MRSWILFPILLLSLAFIEKPHKVKLWLIGDSTMSIKETNAYPQTGWGMPFAYYWDSTVAIENRAMNGRSTRTFIEEKRWESALRDMQEGDYAFIQFGHNDEAKERDCYVPETEYRKYLIQYVKDTRDKKAIPILLTPFARRKFDSNGVIIETHASYAQVVREVAKETNTILFDMDEKSKALLQEWGPQGSINLFNYLKPGEHPNYPDGKKDDTHFNELGARKMAELVLIEIKRSIPDLNARIFKGFRK